MIKVHYIQNEPWGREHLSYFERITEYLQIFFKVEVKIYKPEQPIEIDINLPAFGEYPKIGDTDYIIENTKTQKIKIISFGEYFLHHLTHWCKNDRVETILLGHFSYHYLYGWGKSDENLKNLNKLKPFIFLTFEPFNPVPYRNNRKNDKLFFLGSGLDSYRNTVKIVNDKGYLQPIESVSRDKYLELLSEQKIGLSHYLDLNKKVNYKEHTGEFCYRDIEYMAIGIPFIRIEFRDVTYDPILPNIHYLPILREEAYLAYEKNGNEGLADLYIKKYEEVRDDTEFLEYISKNQIEWYDRNNKSPESEQLTFKLLELNKWQ